MQFFFGNSPKGERKEKPEHTFRYYVYVCPSKFYKHASIGAFSIGNLVSVRKIARVQTPRRIVIRCLVHCYSSAWRQSLRVWFQFHVSVNNVCLSVKRKEAEKEDKKKWKRKTEEEAEEKADDDDDDDDVKEKGTTKKICAAKPNLGALF